MRVVIVSQYFWPEGRTYAEDLATGLTERGHRVRILTGFPNYPHGKLYRGYRQQCGLRERHHGIPLLRVPLFIDHSQSVIRRTLNYLSFAFSAATAHFFVRRADVVYVYAPQMTAAFGPWLWRLFGGPPYVVHVQDLWPDSIVGSTIVTSSAVGKRISAAIPRLLNPWLKSVYRRASSVIAIAPKMAKTLIARGALEPSTRVVFNWPYGDETSQTTDRASSTIEMQERAAVPKKVASTRFIFAGNTGDMQDLETVIRAAHACRHNDLEVLIVGSGLALPALKALAAELNATNVIFTGRVPGVEMPHYFASSDFGLVTLRDLPLFHGTIPSKLQSLLAVGLPVVTTVRGDVRAIVEKHRLGFATEPENPEALAETFRRAAALATAERAEFSQRAIDAYRAQFSFVRALNEIEDILMCSARGRRINSKKNVDAKQKESRFSHA